MKKIIDSRKLFGVTAKTELQELKTLYRNRMKEVHPDKFQDEARKHQAEEESKHIIEAYHFLVSISPETHAISAAEYEKTITSSPITEHHYKAQTLHVTFADGSIYEYFDVPNNVYNKFINTDGKARFARRHIFHSFPYRNVKEVTVPEPAQ